MRSRHLRFVPSNLRSLPTLALRCKSILKHDDARLYLGLTANQLESRMPLSKACHAVSELQEETPCAPSLLIDSVAMSILLGSEVV